MKKHKDGFGRIVKPLDVLLESTGFSTLGGQRSYNYTLWEFPEEYYEGQGYHYDLGGDKEYFKWARLENSQKVDFSCFPDHFRFSFYHGLWQLSSPAGVDTSVYQIINNSDWEANQVTPNQVAVYMKKKTLKIETIEDIKQNIKLLRSPGPTPFELAKRVFEVCDVPLTPVYNGEIGIASLTDAVKYRVILDKFV